MILSGSDAVIAFYGHVPSTSTIKTVVTDVNGNVMPAGTTVAFAITSGTITSATSSFTLPDSTACLAGSTKIKTAQTQTGSAAPLPSLRRPVRRANSRSR